MKKNILKKVIAGICAVITVAGGVIVSNTSAKEVEDINVVATMSDKISKNSCWCGTFQLVWNEMKNEFAKQDIIFDKMFPMVENLNKEEFTKKMLSDEYYYINYGNPTKELKKEIEKGIQKKFRQSSDVLNDIEWDGDKDKYIFYSMLYREFEFEYKFDVLKKGKFGNKSSDVKYFGIDENTEEKVGSQIDVLYYNNEDDFAIVISTMNGDELVFCKNPEGKTYNEIYNNMNKKASGYNGNTSFGNGDVLKVPYMDFARKMEYTELKNKSFQLNNPELDFNTAKIEKAIQTIKFSLDEKGGRVKSEALLQVTKDAFFESVEENRKFNIDDNFALFLREEGRDVPYFAMNVEDIAEFQ